MKTLDYIIVGCGLAGVNLCYLLEKNNKSFVVFDNASQQSSLVAGGMYNPVILKRFTDAWKAKEQLKLALPIYKELEKKLQIKINYPLNVLRKFTSIEEQNNWFIASEKKELKAFLQAALITNTNPNLNAPFNFGNVLNTGRIDTKTLIAAYKTKLSNTMQLFEVPFNYSELNNINNSIEYKGLKAKRIIFCEGFGLKQNPFFNHLPLTGTKGELLTIHAPDLKLDAIIKSSVFIIPLRNNLYRVGATYEWKDKSNSTTLKAKKELETKLKTLINCGYKVVNHVAAIRPTVIDRKPLVGNHKQYKNIYVLNGLGTRGVLIAPYVAQQLYNYIENNEMLDLEISINRF